MDDKKRFDWTFNHNYASHLALANAFSEGCRACEEYEGTLFEDKVTNPYRDAYFAAYRKIYKRRHPDDKKEKTK